MPALAPPTERRDAPPSRAPRPASTRTPGTRQPGRCARGRPLGPDGMCDRCRTMQRAVLWRAASSGAEAPTRAPAVVHDALRTPGRPLDPSTRSEMEPRFGRDFSAVRVHDDARSAESARAVNALAYTVGEHVVFAAGMHRPRSAEGGRLLAHELAHVVQQDGAAEPRRGSLPIGRAGSPEERDAEAAARGDSAPTVRSPAPVLRRTPGRDAADSWREVVTVGPAEPVADEAVRRLLGLEEGAALVNQLWSVLCGGRGGCRSRVHVHFVDEIKVKGAGDADGYFQPQTPDAPRYDVLVEYRRPAPAGVTSVGGVWPQGSPRAFYYSHAEPTSGMASTLHHELLHVWFVHARRGATYPTGHGNVAKDEIEAEFLERLARFSGQLDELERRAREEKAPAPHRPDSLPDLDLDLDADREARRGSGGPAVGGEVSVRAGGAKGFAGVVGADLVLNRLGGLRVGARGIYLTPGHLLAGGALGLRLREGGAGRAGPVRPLFFDLEAGVVAELRPTDAARLTDSIAGLASVGVGQELGRDGPRFFWRVGGFVLVADRRDALTGSPVFAGGATAGVGARF